MTEADRSLQVSFRLTETDLLEFYQDTLITTPAIRRRRWMIRMGGMAMSLLAGAALLINSPPHPKEPLDSLTPDWSRYIMPAILPLFGIAFIIWHVDRWRRMPVRLAREWTKRNERTLNRQTTIALSPQHFVIIDSDSNLQMGWRAIGAICETSHAVVFPLWWGHMIVLCRVFTDDAAFRHFAVTAATLKAAGPNTLAECPKCKYDLRGIDGGCPECGWRRQDIRT